MIWEPIRHLSHNNYMHDELFQMARSYICRFQTTLELCCYDFLAELWWTPNFNIANAKVTNNSNNNNTSNKALIIIETWSTNSSYSLHVLYQYSSAGNLTFLNII